MDIKNIFKKSAIGTLILLFVVAFFVAIADRKSSPDVQTAEPETTSITTTTPTETTTTENTTTTSANTTTTKNTTTNDNKYDYVLNTSTMKYHSPKCSSVKDIEPQNRKDVHTTSDDLKAQGYEPCGRCNPR